MSLRQLKRQVLALLRQEDLAAALEVIAALPPRRAINPLFGLLYHDEALVRWHAITAMGAVTARLADEALESARVVMRRLMWNLNDESGGIGWGSPEAMGEVMACQERLAREYAAILVSYLNPDGNFLEHEGLQRGLLWGMGRLSHARPHLVKDAAPFLPHFLASAHADLRASAAWAAGPIATPILREQLKALRADDRPVTLFVNRCLVTLPVGEWACLSMDQDD